MRRLGRGRLAVGAAMLVLGGSAAAAFALAGGGYTLEVAMPSAAQLVEGSPVLIDGIDAGRVSALTTTGGAAVATIELDADHAPLHAGTSTRVEWRSVLGERVITVVPGPERNPEIPSGALYEAESTQIEVDQVLAALDEPTRARLTALIGRLDTTFTNQESNLRETLRTAGPAVRALGEVLQAIGRDGPAIRALITQLNDVTKSVTQRQQDLRSTISNLTSFTGVTAAQQERLSKSLAELPPTLREAIQTLDRVSPASHTVTPLLDDLRPATSRLPAVAEKLGPAFRDLRPAVADLRPTLEAASALLDRTPRLLDMSHGVLPATQQALDGFHPAVSFLRPWMPEAAGWLTNWGQAFAPYDSQGHVWSAFLTAGPSNLDESPAMPPGLARSDEPVPGESSGQPWTDAHGSGMR